MKPKTNKIITPSPFYQIGFGCSNRAFYEVKNEIYDIAQELGVEYEAYVEDRCDYEGDLDTLIVYSTEESKEYVRAILSHYGLTADIGDINIHLTI